MNPFIEQLGLIEEILAFYPAVGWSVVAIAGLMSGSFLSCVIYRIPKQMLADWRYQAERIVYEDREDEPAASRLTLLSPRSHCTNCQQTIRWFELIPIVGFIIQRGKCRFCGDKISLFYPLLEIVCCAWAIAVFWRYGFEWNGGSVWVFGLFGFALALIDIRHMLLPDQLVIPLLWLGLIINYFDLIVPFGQSFWGCILGYLFFSFLAVASHALLKKEALGWGDVKLFGALGAWLGWQVLPLIMFVAATSALVFLILRAIIKGTSVRQPMPFGVFLIAGASLLLYFELFYIEWLL